MMDGMLSTYLEQVKDRVNSCEEFYELQQQQWQESIRLRTEEGIVKTIAGVGTMILGGMLVVATCGMALPLVATVGVMAIGAGTAAYGFSNTVEGGQDVYAGVTGDPRMVSVNPIRDTLFASNPDLYYLIGNTLTISASLLLTGGMAANAAVSAGTSIGRAVVTEYAKQGLTVAASSYVEKSMTEATNSPLAGFVVGSLTGIATYGTLSELDSMANVSGLHSSFAEGMSKEDAQKYLDFLENGSKEGLTEAEIRGIGKVDEALALKKVNPEELLELRKQQLGNVGESGSSTKLYSPVEYKGSVKVNGEVRDVSRRVYQRNDIDINYYDEVTGLTNLERMQAGTPPIGSDGKQIQLHHILQREAGPMVEIRETTHQGYYSQLHGLIEDGVSFRNDSILNKQYNNFRRSYWKWRAEQIIGGQ